MPTYCYSCPKCDCDFEIVKSVARYADEERCQHCGFPAERRISRVNIANTADWKPTFNPAFGKVVKSRRHQREILAEYKDRGREMIEIGNEPIDSIHGHFDKIREDRRNERWAESTDKIMKEGLE